MRSFLVGIMLGAVAGMLYAPATGNRTRSLLRDKANKYRNTTADFLDVKSRHLSNQLQGAKHRANEAMDCAREQASKVTSTVKENIDQVREQVQGSMNQVDDQIQRSA